MSYIEITEDWVKDRVKIEKEKLDDIKSLSLPGTFDEKILDLGTSLIHFTRLKDLDLSRNVIECLDGLSTLKCLESLNLYYNNVASLKELYKLRNNQKLTQLDLRLNPVARNEADYRLCLIHMLPLLIRLDDRCVKDEERKAALMYFGSDQSREFSLSKPDDSNGKPNETIMTPQRHMQFKKIHPRVDMVNRWTKGVLADSYLENTHPNNEPEEGLRLNLNDLDKQAFEQDMASAISGPREKDYRSMIQYSPRVNSGCDIKKRLDVEREINSFRISERPSNISTVPVYIRPDDKPQFYNNNKYSKISAPNALISHSSLNPDKAHGDGFISEYEKHDYSRYSAGRPNANHREHMNYESNVLDESVSREVTDKICDLVDRYWNGSRSLHQNEKFLTNISKIILSHFQSCKSSVYDSEKMIYPSKTDSANKTSNSTFQSNKKVDHYDDKLEDIKHSNDILKDEIRELKQKLKISEKVSELTDLLKQSHNSLITTNEQLRRQLDNQIKRNLIKNEK